MLRTVLEKSASFHGFNRFTDCIDLVENEAVARQRSRLINALSHGNHSLYDPTNMPREYKEQFIEILNQFLELYRFNPDLIQRVGR